MPFRLLTVVPVLLGVAFAQLALGLSTQLIPLLLLQQGVGSTLIGIVGSAYFIGFLIGALGASWAVRRVGHVRAFALFAAICADCALLMVWQHGAVTVALVRLVTGLASSGFFVVAESWLNDRADSANRGRVFSSYLVASWGATALGPLALTVVAPSPVLFVLVGVGFASAVLPMAATVQPNPPVPLARRLSPWALARISPLGLACAGVAGALNSVFYALVSVYLEQHGHAGATAGIVSASLVAALLVQVPVGWLADRFGRRRMTLAVLVVGFAAAFALVVAGWPGVWPMAALATVYAGATAPLYGLGAGQTNDRIGRGDYVAASGGLLFTWAVGASAGPGIVGAVMGRVGPGGLFSVLAGILGAMIIFTLYRATRRPEVRGSAVDTPPANVG